jgi:DNA polymerase elongation subunit (family B)
MKQRILHFDIETAPMSGYMWRPKTEYIPHNQRLEDSFMLTWAAKWAGTNKMMSDFLDPEHIAARDDAPVVESLAELVREADIVVAHNARRFDVPRLNGRLLVLQLEPLTPFRVIDTLQVARASFDLPYNRLDYLAQILLGEGKIDTDFDLWRDVMNGSETAMRRMVRYNRKDVRLLEGLFDAMLPYAKGLPRMVRADYDGEFACPYCGSHDMMGRGYHDTNAQTYHTWQCNICQRYSRERTNDQKRLRLVPIP